MKKIKVIAGVLSVGAGQRLALSPAQAKPRAHKLDPATAPGGEPVDGVFVASAVLHFKTGEELGIDEVGKGQLDQVEFIEPATAEAAESGRRRRA